MTGQKRYLAGWSAAGQMEAGAIVPALGDAYFGGGPPKSFESLGETDGSVAMRAGVVAGAVWARATEPSNAASRIRRKRCAGPAITK